MDNDNKTKMKLALGIEYNGATYSGWQKQPGFLTLQGELEKALSRIADHPIDIFCAGRTDAGVHATQQVVHFISSAQRDLKAWVFGTNVYLPPHIRVQWVKEMPDDFHARFSARARRYVYMILNQSIHPALYRQEITFEHRPLDESRMHEAAQCLVGEHDFSSFRSAACQSLSPFRSIDFIRIQRQGDLVIMDIQANAFLHHMVRNIAGVLLPIGYGERDPHWAYEVLKQRDRRAAGKTASPNGLYLVQVHYDAKFDLRFEARLPFFLSHLPH